MQYICYSDFIIKLLLHLPTWLLRTIVIVHITISLKAPDFLLVEHSSCICNMKRTIFSNSQKNIPVPSRKYYQLQLIDNSECIIKQSRWKAHFFKMMLIAPVTEWLKKPTISSPSITSGNVKN